MTTPHDFMTMPFPGGDKSVCRHCACLATSPQAGEDCPGPKVPTALPHPPHIVSTVIPKDPVEFLRSLDSEQIKGRIATLEGELAGMKVLLKVAQAQDKAIKAKKEDHEPQ